MSKKRNWLKTTIAMITLIATVLETGFTSVSTLAAEITTEDGIVVDTDAVEDSQTAEPSGDDLDIEVVTDDGGNNEEGDAVDFVDETEDRSADFVDSGDDFEGSGEDTFVDEAGQGETYEESEELKEGSLDVTDRGISGSGYDSISIYVNTDDLAKKDTFRLSFTGPESASYNSKINDELDKTSYGRYDFDNLEGGDFTVRATASDDVILSYRYNADGYPEIVVASRPVEKTLNSKTITTGDGETATAIVGAGFDSFTVNFDTKELSKGVTYRLLVDTEADASVKEVTGLGKDSDPVTIEDLDSEEFTAYVVCEDRGRVDRGIESEVDFNSSNDDAATIVVKDYTDGTYKFEDDKVLVTARVEKKGAVPANAYFDATPLDEEEAARYLEALNENAEEGVEYTEENTLLYDISFYTDDSKEEVIEPEEGSVTFTIEFKRDQLTEELGAEEAEEVEVNHLIEEGSQIVVDDTVEADVANDVGSVEIKTDSFSVFALSRLGGDAATVTIKGQNGTYYAAIRRKETWGMNYVGNPVRIDVVNGTGSGKVKPWAQDGNGEIVLLSVIDGESVNVQNGKEYTGGDVNNKFVAFGDGDFYNFSNKLTFSDFDYNKKEQVITVAPAGSGVSASLFAEKLANPSNFAIVANEFIQHEHYEGNIAVNSATFSGNPVGSNGTERAVNLKIKIEKTVVPAASGTFTFGIYDSQNKEVRRTTVTTGSDGKGSAEITINNAMDSYKVYELDGNTKLENNGKLGNFTVTYGTSAGLENNVSNYGVSSFAKVVNGVTSLTANKNTVLYTTSSGVTLQNGSVVKVSDAEFEQMVDIGGMLSDVSELSSALAGAGSSNEVVVYNVKSNNFPVVNGGKIHFPAVNGNPIIVFNIVIPDKQSSFRLGDIEGGMNNFYVGDKEIKFSGYESDLSKDDYRLRTVWNFLHEDGTPYTGTVYQTTTIPGTFLMANGTLYGANGTPVALYANKVEQLQGAGEIHKGGFTFDTNNNANVEVYNTSSNTNGNLKIKKTFVGKTPYWPKDKQKVKFTVTGPNNFNRVVTYNDFTNGVYEFKNIPLGEYQVVEENGYNVEKYTCETTYSVQDGKTEVTANSTSEVEVTNTYTEGFGILALCKSFCFDDGLMPVTDFYFKIVDHNTKQQVLNFNLMTKNNTKVPAPANGLLHIHLDEDIMFGRNPKTSFISDTNYAIWDGANNYYTQTIFAVDLPIGTYDVIECDQYGNEYADTVFGIRNNIDYKLLEKKNELRTNPNSRTIWDRYASIKDFPLKHDDCVRFTEKDIVWNVHINNSYKATGDTKIPFIKKVNDSSENVPSSFKFKIEGQDQKSKDKFSTREVTNNGSQIEFGPLSFSWKDFKKTNNSGVNKEAWTNGIKYTYKVTENKTGLPKGYSADSVEYIVEVIVKGPQTDEQVRANQLDITKKYYRLENGNRVEVADPLSDEGGAIFNNPYNGKGKVHVYARKFFNLPLDGGEFEFTLTKKDGSGFRDANGNMTNTKSIVRKNEASGTTLVNGKYAAWIDFGEIVYTSEDKAKGDNYLVIQETSTAGENDPITYSTLVYEIEIEITDAGQGNLNVKAKPNKVGKVADNDVSFINTFVADNEINFQVEKILKDGVEIPSLGKDFNKFDFKLQEVDASFNPLQGAEVKTQTITGFGVKDIGTYEYKSETVQNAPNRTETHYYKIEEVPNTSHTFTDTADNKTYGVHFDDTYYIVKVVVSVDRNATTNKYSNRLKKEATVYTYKKGNPNPVKTEPYTGDTFKADFTNWYDILPTKEHVSGTKELISSSTGDDKMELEAGDFEFELKALAGNSSTGIDDATKTTAVQMPTNNKVRNGNVDPNRVDYFEFDDITFKKAGTYEFEISETNEGKDGIVYTTDSYIATIKVEDIGGKLSVVDGYPQYKLVRNNERQAAPNGAKFINYEGGAEVPIFAHKNILTGLGTFVKAPKAGEFEFELYKDEVKDGNKVGASQFNDADGNVTFSAEDYGLTYDLKTLFSEDELNNSDNVLTKTFNYVVHEVPGTSTLYDYDPADKPVQIIVTYTKSTKVMEATAKDGKGYPDPVQFDNPFEATGEAEIGGYKKAVNWKFTTVENGLYEAVLTPDSNNPAGAWVDENGNGQCDQGELDHVQIAPIVKVDFWNNILQNIQNFLGGDEAYVARFDFKNIHYPFPGVYNYTITERATDKAPANISVDSKTINVTVTVTDDTVTVENGQIKYKDKYTVERVYDNDPDVTPLFVNRRTVEGSGEVEAKKNLWIGQKGAPSDELFTNEPKAGDFLYDLVDVTDSTSTYTETDVPNEDGGHVTFKAIPYTTEMLGGEKEKVFTYKITEQPVNDGFTTYDTSEFFAEVTVKDTGAATLDTTSVPVKYYYYKTENGVKTKVYTGNEGVDIPEFNNYQDAEGPLVIPVSKILTGRDGLTDETFTFRLYKDESCTIPVKDPVTKADYVATVPGSSLKNGQPVTVDFPAIQYKLKDMNRKDKETKYYYIKEDKVNSEGLECSGAKWKVEAELTLKKSEAKIDAKIVDANDITGTESLTWLQTVTNLITGDLADVFFTNKYTAKGKIQIVAEKVLKGRELSEEDNGKFEFTLKAENENGKTSETIANDTNGLAYFAPVEFAEATKPGKYYTFTVKEEIPSDANKVPGVRVYDTEEHKIYVQVVDNNKGKLEVYYTTDDPSAWTSSSFKLADEKPINVSKESGGKYTVELGQGTAYVPGVVTLVNEYIPSDVEKQFIGKKILLGKRNKDYLFKFTLTGHNVNGAKGADGEEVQIVKNEGPVKFAEIAYTADDLLVDPAAAEKTYKTSETFDYIITEARAENTTDDDYTGIVWDEFDARKITVEVKDNNGTLEARIVSNVKYKTADTNDTADANSTSFDEAFTFTNMVGSGGLELPVAKIVKGASAEVKKGKKFYFELLEGTTGNNRIGDLIELSDQGSDTFKVDYTLDQLKKDTDGVYRGEFDYRVREVSDKRQGVTYSNYAGDYDGFTYDLTEYNVHVFVEQKDNNSDLSVTKTITYVDRNGETKTAVEKSAAVYPLEFVNEYDAKGYDKITGLKVLLGRLLRDDEEYTFILEDEEGNTKEATTVTDPASKQYATFSFGTDAYTAGEVLNYTREDLKRADGSYAKSAEKTFTLYEKNHGETIDGVTYSDAEWLITVSIVDDGKGALNVTHKIKQTRDEFGKAVDKEIKDWIPIASRHITAELPKTDVKAQNVYYAKGLTDPPVISKKVMGAEVEPNKFQFKLVDKSGDKLLLEENGKYERKDSRLSYNDAQGKIEFGEVHYTLEDFLGKTSENGYYKFVYVATELEPEDKSFNRSPAEFEFVRYMYDDGKGHIVEATAYDVPGYNREPVQTKGNAFTDEEYNSIFLNTYQAETEFGFEGTKTLTGREMTDKDIFSFELSDLTEGSQNKPIILHNTDAKIQNASGKVVPTLIKATSKEVDWFKYRYGEYADPTDSTKTIKVDETGSKKYRIRELNQNMPAGVSYDPTEYEITFDVVLAKNTDGTLKKNKDGDPYLEIKNLKTVKITVVNEKGDTVTTDVGVDDVEFINPFDASGKIDIPGKKYLKTEDDKPITDKKKLDKIYEFVLYGYKDSARIEGKKIVDFEACDANGEFVLDIPKYTMEDLKNPDGTYELQRDFYYRIVEDLPSAGDWKDEAQTIWECGGIVYDNTEYDLTVHVEYVGTQDLKITKEIVKAATGEKIDVSKAVEFTNTEEEFAVKFGTKYWIDKGDPEDHPPIKILLYSSAVNNGKTDINDYIIDPGKTTYRFTTDRNGVKLPKFDKNGRLITYTVEEDDVYGYISEKVGDDFYNTKGDILIRKVDADTGVTLSGAVLAILDGTTEIERWTSGVSAHVVENMLTAGKTYTLHEVSAPEGYELAPDQTFTVPADGSMITVTMSDKPIVGRVRLIKRDATTRDPLAGAEFELVNEAGTSIYAVGTAGSYRATTATSNKTFVTDSAGELVISDLPYGTYYFIETKAPTGYTLSRERSGFSITRNGELTEVTFFDTKATGAVRLRKIGSRTTRGLAGAVFELYAATPRTAGQAATATIFSDAYYRVDSFRTNSAGEIYVDDLPWDDYYFIEVEAPAGYEIATDINGDPLVYTFTVGATTAELTYDLGSIINYPPEEETPPPPTTTTLTPTRTPTGGVLGARVEKGGVVNGVLGVRAKPNSGVLGARVGPVTGDTGNIILWLLLLTACVATIVATIMTGKKKKTAK